MTFSQNDRISDKNVCDRDTLVPRATGEVTKIKHTVSIRGNAIEYETITQNFSTERFIT